MLDSSRRRAHALVLALAVAGDGGVDRFAPPPTAAIAGKQFARERAAAPPAPLARRGFQPGADAVDGGASVGWSATDGNGGGGEDGSPWTRPTTRPPSALWPALTGGGPPFDVDDAQLLIYDVFLLMNLSFGISYLPGRPSNGAVFHTLDPRASTRERYC